MTTSEKQRIRTAINELASWHFFDKEFGWTSYKTIRCLVNDSISKDVAKIKVEVV